MRYVNTNKDQTLNNPNVVIGMGIDGVISSYALRALEIDNYDHQTSRFISIDVPHKEYIII